MGMMRLREAIIVGAALLCGAMTPPVLAANKAVNMSLTVVINAAPPCTITGGTVEFGDVLTTKVNGENYLQTVGYSLSCSGRLSDFLKLQIQGNAIVVNGESVLQTDVPGLGIRLQTASDKTLIAPGSNTWLPFQYTGSNGPEIQAIPVKNNGLTLTGGAFNAGATLVVDYQ